MLKKQKIDLNKEVRNMGIIFLVLGVLHFILSGFLDPTWGIILITVGIIAFFYRSRNMLLVLGIMLILVGILNMSSFVFYPDEVSGGWGFFAIIQIIWGIQEIIKFKKIKENPKYRVKETKKKIFVWYGLRVGFWSTIGLWVFFIIIESLIPVNSGLYIFLSTIWVVSIIFTFVVSIIHLVKYKNKAFAILALIVPSLLVLATLFGMIYAEIYNEPFVMKDSGTLNFDEYVSIGFSVYSQGYMDVTVTTSSPSNIYILQENEFSRYKEVKSC